MFGSFPVFGNGWQEAANTSKRQHDLDIDRANLEIEQRNQEILDLEKNSIKSNPTCKKCNKKMKSQGQNQDFQCIKCGKIAKSKITLEIPRKVKKQLYLPEISAHRHLTRPPIRLGRLNKKSQFEQSGPWFSVYKN